MIALSIKTKEAIKNKIGISVEELIDFSDDQEKKYIEEKFGKIRFQAKIDDRRIGRGNPLLAKGKIRTMEEVDAALDLYCK